MGCYRRAFENADETFCAVVGYANDTLTKANWKSVCSQFLKIGSEDGSDMTLKDLVPGGEWGNGSDKIKILTKDATLDFDAVYMPAWADLTAAQKRAVQQKGRTEANWVAGWYPIVNGSNDYTADKNATPLPFGTCVLVRSSATGAYITTNGEVVQSEDRKIVSELVKAEWKFIGNCTPIARTLKDFIPGNGWANGSDKIKILTTDATLDFDAVYMPTWADLTAAQKRAVQQKGRTEANWVAGWYPIVNGSNDYTADVNSTPIVAGAGFLARSSTTGATITQPSAL